MDILVLSKIFGHAMPSVNMYSHVNFDAEALLLPVHSLDSPLSLKNGIKNTACFFKQTVLKMMMFISFSRESKPRLPAHPDFAFERD